MRLRHHSIIGDVSRAGRNQHLDPDPELAAFFRLGKTPPALLATTFDRRALHRDRGHMLCL
ncbi:MAG: hypothetical protein ACI9S9_004023, partial [Planctomycetota bacterium]